MGLAWMDQILGARMPDGSARQNSPSPGPEGASPRGTAGRLDAEKCAGPARYRAVMRRPARLCPFVALAACLLCAAPAVHATGTINVNSFAQRNPPATNSVCTLGAAIITANTNTLTDACTLASGTLTAPYTINLLAGTYTLTFVDSVGGFGVPIGLPGISNDITVQGAAAATTIIQRSTVGGTPGSPSSTSARTPAL